MIRLRTASAVATLSMLTWAATASAECAWVLWQSPLKSSMPRWEILEAYQVKAECDKRAESIDRDFNPRHPKAPIETLCLPDTVDPRGPKAGR